MKAKLLEKISPVEGLRLGVAASGEHYEGRNDLLVIELVEGSRSVCLFTKNIFCAAPVTIARRHLKVTSPQYLIVNAGNANAGTGIAGERDALEICQAVASRVGCAVEGVLPFSTGVIGQAFRTGTISRVVGDCFQDLSPCNWSEAGRAIMTTDTRLKARSATVELNGVRTTVTGIAKGSGMIKPDMATMLAFVATDASVSVDLLQSICEEVADLSFNRITVDGDTSTNDSFALMATGATGAEDIVNSSEEYVRLKSAILLVCSELAKDIVRDGEGATKLVNITVFGFNKEECTRVAYAVAESPLVKTALFASDANWGRILAAVGRSAFPTTVLENICIEVSGVPLLKNGEPVVLENMDNIKRAFSDHEIDLCIRLDDGAASTTVWTCDFSYDYVRINAEYRT